LPPQPSMAVDVPSAVGVPEVLSPAADMADHCDVPGAPGACADARTLRTGSYGAWLSKTKSDGAWLKKLSSTTSRYFTIDFDRQLFYYTHSESSKKISNPVSFREITGAERMPQPAGSSKKKSSKTMYGFSVTTQSRTFELYTTSNPDAAQWVYALNAAKDIAAERSAQGPTTAEKPAECQEASPALPPKPVGGLAPLKPGGRRIIEASCMDNPDAQEVAADAETIAAADRQEANTPDPEATGSDSGGPQPPCKPPPAVNSDKDAFAALRDLESLVGSGAPATPPALKQASLDPAVAFASWAEADKSAAEKEEMAVKNAEAEKMAAEKAEASQLAAKKAEAEQLAAEKAEAEQLAAKTAEAEKLAAEKAEADKLAVEKAETQKLLADKTEAEKLAAEKAEAEKLAVEKAEAERLAVKKAEAEQLAAQQTKADQLAAEKAEAEKLVATKAEAEILAAEKAEDEKLAAEKAAAQKASAEKAAAEKALAENADAEKASAEQAASEKALKQKLAADKLAADILSADDDAPKAVEALDEKEQGAKTACTPELVVASAVEQNPLKPAADTAGDTADAKAPTPAAEKVEEEKKPEAPAAAVPAGGALPPLQKKPVPGALPPLSGGGKAAAWSISLGNEDEDSKSLASAAPPLRNKAPDKKEKKKAKAKAFNCGPPAAEQEGNKEASGWDSEGDADGKPKSLASAAPPLKSRSSDRKKEKKEKKSSSSSIPAGPATNQDGKEASGWDSDGEKNNTIKAAVVHSPVVKSASASTAVAAAAVAPPAMKEASGWDSDDDAKEKASSSPPAPPNAPGAAPSGFDDDSDDDEAAFGKARKEAKMCSKAKADSCGASQPAGNGGFVVAKPGSAAAAAPQAASSSSGDAADELLGLVAGETAVPRAKASGSHGFVPDFHCTGCDFQVLRIENYVFGDDANYMFFRNNYPNVMKLRKHLMARKDCSAYCCQCSWRSAEAAASLSDVAEGLRWRVIAQDAT